MKRNRCSFVISKAQFYAQIFVCFAIIKQSGKNIWLVGGGEIVKIFLENDLLDEIIISIHPIVLGDEIPLFAGAKEIKLELANHKIFKNGLVQLHYKVIR